MVYTCNMDTHISTRAIIKLTSKLLDLKYRLGVPTNDIHLDWPTSKIRSVLNVTNSDPTGRLAAQIRQAFLQGVL